MTLLGKIITLAMIFVCPELAYARLEIRNCGAEYGGLSFIFKPGVTPSILAHAVEKQDWAQKIYETSSYGIHEKASAYRRLLSAPHYSYVQGASGIAVPIGSEEFVAEKLRKTGLVSDVALPWGDCGGAEISIFDMGKWPNQLILSDVSNFKDVIGSVSQQYVLSKKIPDTTASGVVEVQAFKPSPVPPNLPLGRIKFRVASEISRDTKNNSTWDQFDVVFSLGKVDKIGSMVVVTVENFETAPRAGRKSPPSEEHFRRSNGNEPYDEETIIASSITAFFAHYFKGKCRVEAEGFDIKGDPFNCVN